MKKRSVKRSVTKRTRYHVLRRDDFTCRYCGRSAPEVVLEVDHVMPLSLGGSNHEGNLVTACVDCNRGKAATPPKTGAVKPTVPRTLASAACQYCGKEITSPARAQLVLLTYGEGPWCVVHDRCLAKERPGVVVDYYWIDLADLTTRKGIAEWDQHLREKTWIRDTNWWQWRDALMRSLGSARKPVLVRLSDAV